jgi:type IV pilus assembly protein PilY1
MFKPTLPCDRALRAGLPLVGTARVLAAAALVALPFTSLLATDLSSVPLPTYTVGSSVDIKPNILMVLDDSGSMDWDYLPDWANDTPPNYSSLPSYLTRNSAFNGVAYNPAVRYDPPMAFSNTGLKDPAKYPSMNGMSAAAGADATKPMPNWQKVKRDGYGVQSTSTSDLTNAAYYYTTVAGEFCNSPALTSCTTTTVATGNFAYAAPLRWCNGSSLATCRGLQDGSYNYPRMPAPRIATVTMASSGNSGQVSSIKVDGLEIMASASAATSSDSDLAASVASRINQCTLTKAGNCGTVGYAAIVSSNTVYIVAPGVPGATSKPEFTHTSQVSFSVRTVFDRSAIPLPGNRSNGTSSTGTVPGENLLTVITPTVTQYPLQGNRPATRTDCGATKCSYEQEMTNYANWFAYYRTRMQMMKTATSRAFAALDTDENIAAGATRYRVGYLTLNNNTGTDFVNMNDFGPAQKFTWFSKLFAARPNSGTPLRDSLAKAGQLYGGVLNGTTLNGVTVTEPLQFSCQKNYTILSTDGFWNGGAGEKLDRASAIGNADGLLPRPYNDGGTSITQTRTSKLQKRTLQLQTRTSNNKGKNWSGWSNVATCTPDNSGDSRRECRWDPNSDDWTDAGTCTISGLNASGKQTECQYTNWNSWSNVGSCVPVARSAGPNFTVATARECQGTVTGGTSNTLADVAAYYYMTDLRSPTATGADATGTCTGPIIPPATTPTDLCANDVQPNGRDNSPQQHMTTHTLGLGAQGRMVFSPFQNNLAGQRIFSPDYWSQPTGDFHSVSNGAVANPGAGVCPWMSSGSICTWPTPAADSPANIDDLWHAAVNGHGTYFSAADPASLAAALSNVLATIVNEPRPGTAAAAASSNPNITSSDNYVFSSSYRSVDWHGELIMQRFNPDGTLTSQQWSAMQMLDCSTSPWRANKTYVMGESFNQGGACYVVESGYTSGATFAGGTGLDGENIRQLATGPRTRTVYTVGASGLVPFTWTDLSAAQRAYFSTPYINYVSAAQGLTQFCTTGPSCMGAAAQTSASGQALVDFLRGDRTNEGTYFRARAHVLGDIVSSEARYVKKPAQNYLDPGYADYKEKWAERDAVVYVGANDGMLHAFDANTGQERWAFVPSAVLPEMYRLADAEYQTKHRYFVDGTPEVGDICPTAPTTNCDRDTWRTIIVGGLNQGGKSYYALDITNPASPTLLWEFTRPELGYSYSNPRITKLKNGTWVVIVASGYNNTDGVGRLFVLNAHTGGLISTISTATGTAANPSGLAKLSARAPTSVTNNVVHQVYGGDLLGNVWRFDVNGDVGAPGMEAHLLVNLRDPNGNPQPITGKPTVASVAEKPMVMIGTGRYLGVSDLTETTTQSMYGVRDKLDGVTLPSPRTAGSNFVQQTMLDVECPNDAPSTICTQGQVVRTVSENPVDWGIRNGWYTDFLIGGERAVTDPTLALGTLVFTTVKPQSSTAAAIQGCSAEDVSVNAKSYLYYLNYLTGGPVQGTKAVVGEELCTCIATRPSVVKTQGGVVQGIIRTSGGGGGGENNTQNTDMGQTNRQDLPWQGEGGATRRISYRELTGE